MNIIRTLSFLAQITLFLGGFEVSYDFHLSQDFIPEIQDDSGNYEENNSSLLVVIVKTIFSPFVVEINCPLGSQCHLNESPRLSAHPNSYKLNTSYLPPPQSLV